MIILDSYETLMSLIPKGLYRNKKNKQLYSVIAIARHSEDKSLLVVYQQEYGNRDVWCRPAEMWYEKFDKVDD